MSSKELFQAACEGDVEKLNKLLQENPSLLRDITFASLSESVLHVATKAGQVNFVVELLKHKLEMARELNKDGFRPLDIAAIMGNVKMVQELVRLDPGVCLLKGKDRRTALHHAACKGKVEVIDELICNCPDCLKDVTFNQETALHLALTSYQFDAFKALVKWIEIHKLQAILNWQDRNGNTVLHLAASTKQHECIELILFSKGNIRTRVDVKAKNSKGLTAADVLDILMENPDDFRSRNVLQHAAASNPSESSLYLKPKDGKYVTDDLQSDQLSKNWFKYFKFQMRRDSPSNTRNALLVVAALIATVTFQAGLTPPDGILDKPDQQNSQNQAGPPPPPMYGPVTGAGLVVASAIFGSNAPSYLFLFSNSLGLSASLSIIVYLTAGFPFQRELLISICAMMSSYAFSISSILKGEKNEKEFLGYLNLTVAFLLPFLLRWLPTWLKMAWKKCSRKSKSSQGSILPVES